jgi:hypothetical protein
VAAIPDGIADELILRYTNESSSIAFGASLRYVLGSLACARQVVLRGRRGRRRNLAPPLDEERAERTRAL